MSPLGPPEGTVALSANRTKIRHHQLRAILAMDETKQYVRFGCGDIVAYVKKYLKVSPSTAYEYVDVARKLPGLPLCAAWFEKAKISWSQLRLLASVVKAETEEEWLAFAAERTLRELEIEVRDAKRRGGRSPAATTTGCPTSSSG